MNPVKGEVPLKLKDGREFVLVMDFEALVSAEAAYRKPLGELMDDVTSGFVGAIRAMLFGALRAKHPKLTLADATSIFMADNDAVTAALEQAATASFPAPDGSEGGNGENPPGSGSGPSGVKPASIRKPSGHKPRARSK